MGGLSKRAGNRASVHLEFGEVPHPTSKKTKLWVVMNAGRHELGKVSWKIEWRRYTFKPFPQTEFDALCLERIAEFCREETRKHYEECERRRKVATLPQ